MITTATRSLLAAFALFATTTIAFADQIDGTWCSPSGQSITIQGPRIVTPGGNVVKGRYNRHHADFELPEGEANSGSRMNADQLNDEQIRVIVIGEEPSANQPSGIWTRCQVIS